MASRSVLVLATVLSVQGKFAYPCCTRCRKRVRTLEQDQKFSCSSCKQYYEGNDVNYRYRISLVVSDRSQVANVTVFGSCLDVFFGASATEFMRFLRRKQSELDNQTIELNKLVHPAMQQCFVGSMLKFGFRLSPPCRMESQILHCSPVNLGNVVSKQQMQKADSSYQAKLEGGQHSTPSVLANLVVPCLSTEYQTVLGILQGYLERLHITASSTTPSPDGRSVHMEDCYEGPGRILSCDDGSAAHCSAATGLGMLTSPLVLTCDSDISNSACFSTSCAEGACSEPAVEDDDLRNPAMMQLSEKGCFEDFSPRYVASQEPEDVGRSSHVSQPLGTTTPASASLTQNESCGYLDSQDTSQLCPEIKWSQLEDLPSSEDLSAFLADLALDCDFTGDEEGQVVVASAEQNTAASNRHNAEWESFNEPNTASNPRHNEWGRFNYESTVAVDKLQNCTEPIDLLLDAGDLTTDAEERLVNEQDTSSDCHGEMRSFNEPIKVMDKLHNFTELTDLVLDGDSTGGAVGLAACDSSECHTKMRNCNEHENYTELIDLALDCDLTDVVRLVSVNSQQAISSGCHDEMDSFDEPIEAVDNLKTFTELTDLPSSEDLEAFLADMDEGCFVEDIYHASHSTSIQAAASTSDSPNSLKRSAPEKTSFIGTKPGKGDSRSEVSTTVVDGYENVPLRGANTITSCRPLLGSDMIRTEDCANEGHDGVGPCLNAHSAEKDHQGNVHKSCSTQSFSCGTPLRVAMDMNKASRATKRTQGDKLTPNNLRVALLRKRFTSSVSSSADLSPRRKFRREEEQCHDIVYETPQHGVGAYSEELFTGVEDRSASHVCDSCSQNHSNSADVFRACEESAGVQEPSILDSSSICSTSGKSGVMRKRSAAQEADKSVTEEQYSYVCSGTCKDSSKPNSASSYVGSPELFSHSSSSLEGSPNLFSSTVNSDEYSSSCEASGSVLLFSSHDSDSSYLSSVCCPESFPDIQLCHSTPLQNSRQNSPREAKAAAANQHLIQCRQRVLRRSTKGASPQSMIISGTGLTESPLMFSQLSNGSLVSSPSV